MLAEASDVVNNAYLKSNNVEDGIASYGRSLKLIILYAVNNGGSCIVAPDAAQPAPTDSASLTPSSM